MTTLSGSREHVAIGSNAHYSKPEAFLKASGGESWAGPAFFENRIPYMMIAIPHAGRNNGVMVAQVDLRFLSDFANSAQAGSDSTALMVSNDGHLIARSHSLADARLTARLSRPGAKPPRKRKKSPPPSGRGSGGGP